MNFIKTQDSSTADMLRLEGFQELPKEGRFFVFVNKTGKQDFSENKKIVYTNKLSFGE